MNTDIAQALRDYKRVYARVGKYLVTVSYQEDMPISYTGERATGYFVQVAEVGQAPHEGWYCRDTDAVVRLLASGRILACTLFLWYAAVGE